jgi:hypothetical protein
MLQNVFCRFWDNGDLFCNAPIYVARLPSLQTKIILLDVVVLEVDLKV